MDGGGKRGGGENRSESQRRSEEGIKTSSHWAMLDENKIPVFVFESLIFDCDFFWRKYTRRIE